MNEKVLHIVEYDKIIARLEEHADSQPGNVPGTDADGQPV